MKSIITLVLFFLCSSLIWTQPLNSSFENWTMGEPDDWFTTDLFGIVNGVSQSSDAHEGSSSAEMTVVDFGGSPWPPFMISITALGGHPVSQKHGSLKGWYKFNPLGNEWLTISIIMTTSDSTAVGTGGIVIENAASSWTEFTAPITYFPGSPDPVETYIYFIVEDTSGNAGTIGTSANIDQLSFTSPSSVEQFSNLPDAFTLKQNYPNPFNPSTKIEYSLPEASYVELKVYDILGNEVSTLVSEEQSAGTYRADFIADNLASGLYVAQLRAGNFSKTIKMTLLR